MKKRTQNIVATSRFALPAVLVYSCAVWLMGGLVQQSLYATFAIFLLSTILMAGLNNSNSLIRVYSRMVSCSFAVMTSAATFLFSSPGSAIVQLFFILFYLSLFRSYQDKRAPGIVFYSFACLGVASMAFVQVLYFVPVLWIVMAVNLMAFSHRMFWASILGLIAPYWFAFGYYAYTESVPEFLAHFAGLAAFGPVCNFGGMEYSRIATLTAVGLLAIMGVTHYLRNSYLDKIRTRMLYEIFITLLILAFIFIILQPQHYDKLMPIIIVNTSCLVAHFIALTKSRLTNLAFLLMCLAMLLLTTYNLWGETLPLTL